MSVHVPEFVKRDRMLVAAIIILAALMAFAAFTLKPELDNPAIYTKEGRLTKVASLGIMPGEAYTYSYTAWNGSMNLTYLVMEGNGCTMVGVEGGSAPLCIDSSGNDRSGQNTSYEVPYVVLLKPWMLAVNDSWRWEVSTYLLFQGIGRHVADVNYTTVRKEYYRGRQAYVVRISSSEGDAAWDWVDSEKRILLREIGQGYEVELTQGLPMEGSAPQ